MLVSSFSIEKLLLKSFFETILVNVIRVRHGLIEELLIKFLDHLVIRKVFHWNLLFFHHLLSRLVLQLLGVGNAFFLLSFETEHEVVSHSEFFRDMTTLVRRFIVEDI
jgi:hypothetical protein